MSKHQRRHVRIPLFHDAVLESAATGAVECKIRDYCPGGMFVAWQGNSTIRQPLLREDTVRVRFLSLQQEEFTVEARVAQTFDAGAGLAFDSIPDDVLEVLRALANTSKATPQAATSDDQQALLKTLQKRITQFSENTSRDFLSQADESLFISASDAKTSYEQTEFLAASKALKAQREALNQRIVDLLTDPDEADPLAPAMPEDNKLELSLVEKDEFENFLSVSAVIARTEPRLKKPLFEIEKRLTRLYGINIDASNNPIGVARVFNAFSRAVELLGLSPMIKNTIFAVLEETVSPNLEHLYKELNELLKKGGILPDLDYDEHQKQMRAEYMRQQTGAHRVQHAPTEQAVESPADAPASTGTGQAASAGGSSPGFADAPAEDDSLSSSRNLAGTTETPENLASLSQQTQALSQQLRQLQDYITHLPGGHDQAVPASSLQSVPQSGERMSGTYSGEQIAEAISLMQQELEATWGHEVRPEEIPQRLQKVLRSHVPQHQDGSIGRKTQQSIELVNDLFDAFADDRFINHQALDGLRHLQPTLYKLSVLDDRFIDDQQHSARKVINHLANLDPEDTQQQQLAQQVSARINDEFDSNQQVFDEVLPQLEAAVDARRNEYQSNLQQVVETLKQQQQALAERGARKPPPPARKQPLELEVWIERARFIQVGDMIALKQNDGQFQRLAVAWVGPDHDPFVFVNNHGIKQATVTLQELALQLRKGNAVILPDEELPASDRAMQQSLYRLQDRLNHQSLYDERTQLPNKKSLLAELDSVVTRAQLGEGTHVLYYLDFNVLSVVDRQWGEDTGTALLRKVIELLREQAPGNAQLASAGGDRFLMLVRNYDLLRGQHMAEAIISTLGEFKFKWKQQSFTLKTSVGLALIDRSSGSADEILAGVEQACAEARAAGAMCHRLFEVEGQEQVSTIAKINWEHWLTETLQKEQVSLYRMRLQPLGEQDDEGKSYLFSPGIDMDNRLHLPEQNFLQADTLAEPVKKLDRLLFSQVLAWMAETGEAESDNVSYLPLNKSSLADARLLDWLLNELTETRVPPSRIGFRIDEQATLAHSDNASILIRTLSEFGCQFLLSGYGRAGSSSTELKDLPINLLGVDPVFIEGFAHSAADQAMVKSICDIGHLLKRRIMALGNSNLSEELQALGVDYLATEQDASYLSDLEQTCPIARKP